MLQALDSPELFFGLCSAVGTDNKKVVEIITETLLKYTYKTTYFKVTELMKQIVVPNCDLKESPVEARYDTYINYANELRRLTGTPSALAIMCCAGVRAYRRKNSPSGGYLESTAYIFDQFKRKEEIEALRQVYGRLFISVSIYSARERREARLANQIATDHSEPRISNNREAMATDLVQRDENEEGVLDGQRLRDTFPLADLFIDVDNVSAAKEMIERFICGLFGSNQISPTREEYGMYMAQSAALRSLDLSRQVGASIFSIRGEIISLGCNEVPKFGGGTYWFGDKADARDYTIGYDVNEQVKRAILADVVRRLRDHDFIKNEKSSDELVDVIISESMKNNSALRDAILMDLLEFGRSIHAEMSAITDAARVGRAISGAILYCTTFPCHICAKHILAAGIEKVVYIEPYPKSYAEHLYRDISVGTEKQEGKMLLSPFIGVAPRRFRELFE